MMAFLVLNPLTTKPEIVWDKIMNPPKKIFNSIDVIVNPAIQLLLISWSIREFGVILLLIILY